MPCPVCGRSFPLSRLSSHVNRCIAKAGGGAEDTQTRTRSGTKRGPRQKGDDFEHETDRRGRKQPEQRLRSGSDADGVWNEIAVGRIPFQSKVLPSRTQARLHKYDELLLTNERLARAEDRRQRKRQRRDSSSEILSTTDEDEVQYVDDASGGVTIAQQTLHRRFDDAATPLHALLESAMAHGTRHADAEQQTDAVVRPSVERLLENEIASTVKAFRAREISEAQLHERLAELIKDKQGSTSSVLKAVAEVLLAEREVGSQQRPPESEAQTAAALEERKRLLQEHTSSTAARTQGQVPIPDDAPLPMKAADYAAKPQDMDTARDFVHRIKQHFEGNPYKLKEFYNLVLQHSRRIKQSGLSSSDVLSVVISFCKVFDGDEGLIGELMTFLPPMKPDNDFAAPAGPAQSLSLEQLRFPNQTSVQGSDAATPVTLAETAQGGRLGKPLSASSSSNSSPRPDSRDKTPRTLPQRLAATQPLTASQINSIRERAVNLSKSALQAAHLPVGAALKAAAAATPAAPVARVVAAPPPATAQPGGYYSAWPYGTVYATTAYPTTASVVSDPALDWTGYARRHTVSALPSVPTGVPTVQYVYPSGTRVATGAVGTTIAYPQPAGASSYATYAYAAPGTAYPTYYATTGAPYPYRVTPVVSGYEAYDVARAQARAYLGNQGS